jgi:diacylglycerol kinase family enzyme
MTDEWGNRVLVVTNPVAGAGPRGRVVHQIVASLEAAHLAPELIHDLDELESRADRYHQAGQLRAIVAAGGDGTVAEVANRTQPGVPITVFPLGTANLLAGYLGMDDDPAHLAQTLLDGRLRRIDAGRANGRLFVLMVGCGFDADVVRRVHARRTPAGITYWTYARPILEAIRSYRYPDLRVYCERAQHGETASECIVARWVFVTNLPCYAGGLRMSPEAVGDDGLLNVATFKNGSLWHGLRYLGYVRFGRASTSRDYHAMAVTRVRIESDEPVSYQLDGDPGGMLPLVVEVLPGRLTLLQPPSAGEG